MAIAGADHLPSGNSATRQHHAEHPRPVIAAACGIELWRAAKLAHRDHERIVEQSSLAEVVNDRGKGLVERGDQPDTNLGTCMDYTNDPDGGGVYGLSNEYPNQHDFDTLAGIYAHTDATNFAVRTVGQSNQGVISEEAGGESPEEWGTATHYDGKGRPDVFEKQVGAGRKKVTHVFWAMGEGPPGQQKHHEE